MSRDADAEAYIDEQIGPRVPGGRYFYGYWGDECTVLAVDRNPDGWMLWSITEATDEERAAGRSRTHCTGWDPRRDRVVA